MTDEQKQAIKVLNRVREKLTDDEYFMMMEFIVREPVTKIEYVPQPSIPWTTPQPLQPYYGGTGDPLQPPYRITCELTTLKE